MSLDDFLEKIDYALDKLIGQRATARTASAAWKASATIHRGNYLAEHEAREAAEQRVAELESNLNAANERASRWEAAWEDIWDYAERKINQALLFYDKYRQEKKRVAELEEALKQAYPFMACECDDEYECTGCGISEARSKVLSAFNK